MYGDQRSFVPVKEGEELDVEIEAVGAKGDGIAKKDGFVLFVPNVKQGDNVRVKVTRVLRKVGFAEVIGEGSSAPAGGDEAPAQEEEPEEEFSTENDSEDFGDEPEGEASEDFGEDAPAEEEAAPAEESEEKQEE